MAATALVAVPFFFPQMITQCKLRPVVNLWSKFGYNPQMLNCPEVKLETHFLKYRSTLKSGSVVAIMSLLVGCVGPAVESFRITPRVLCEGESAVANWDVRGKASMTFLVEPEPAGKQTCRASGKETFMFRLAAASGRKEDEKQVELVQLHPVGAEPIVFGTNRMEGDQVVASGEKNPELWTERVQVASLAACDNRNIQVRHGGRAAMLPAGGAPSGELAGTPLAGEWELRSVLTSDEQRNSTLRPKELEILATFACTQVTP